MKINASEINDNTDISSHFRLRSSVMAVSTLLLLGSSATQAASAYSLCMAPRAPTLYSFKPSKPFCAAMRNCSQVDVDQYRRQLKSYFADLEQYLLDVDKFSKLAYEYAECEAKLD